MALRRTRVFVRETGESPYAVRMEVGAHFLTGDEPLDAGGWDLGPAPFDLMTAALAECTAMTVRWYAFEHNWPLDHVEVAVDHVRKMLAGTSEPVDVFNKTLILRGSRLSEGQRSRLLDIATRCPIQRVLEGSPTIMTKAGTALDKAFDN
jgi:putative redox protein